MPKKQSRRRSNARPDVKEPFDAIDLEVLWSRLITVVDEAAYAVLRTSMSKVVVEARDFGALLLDSDGRLLISDMGVASKIGTNSIAARELLKYFPKESLRPGDMLITNNPWWVMGHLNDVAVVAPLFHKKKLVGFAECMAHMADIGGCISSTPKELYEEGFIIPPMKIMERGVENRTLFSLLQANVRVPRQIASDVRALISGCQVMHRKLLEFFADNDMDDLEVLGGAIMRQSEKTMRAAIRAAIPDGVYRGETVVQEGPDPLEFKVALTSKGGKLSIDFSGSSAQRTVGDNCTLVYTSVWSTYTIKCLLSPRLPNNEGTFAPIAVSAPEGSVLNPRHPAPVRLKGNTGHYIPEAIIDALKDVIGDRCLAESGNKFSVIFSGRNVHDRPFFDSMFLMGGMGARAGKDGLHCICFPANSSNLPTEVLESSFPVLVHHKKLRQDSGGAGRCRGGSGQEFEFESRSDRPLMVRAAHGKLAIPPKGLLGGSDGATGGIYLNGQGVPDKQPMMLKKGDVVRLVTPGSGGMYPASERARELVATDVANHVTSPDKAHNEYRYKAAAGGTGVHSGANEKADSAEPEKQAS